jgi:hypothetical protein
MTADRQRRAGVRTALVGGGLLAAVTLAGCGSLTGGDNAAPATNPPSTNAAAVPANQPTAAAPPAAAASSAPAHQATTASVTPECKSDRLKLTLGSGDAGMSKTNWLLRFTNTGSAPCVLVGFPGVSYVAGDKGVQVGPAAERSGAKGTQVTLAPGHTASSAVAAVTTGVFDPAQCKPTAVRGFRVYPPDETASMFVALPGSGSQGCAGATPSPQLLVQTVAAGAGA